MASRKSILVHRHFRWSDPVIPLSVVTLIFPAETDNPLGYSGQLFSERLRCEKLELEPRNAILDELHDFVISIQTGISPTVDGIAGARAVDLAQQVLESVAQRAWYPNATTQEMGPSRCGS